VLATRKFSLDGALEQIDFEKYSDKGAVPGVNRNHLHMESIVLPPAELQTQFARLVEPLWQRVTQNAENGKTLAALRDTLLPKLLSGEIRVSESGHLMESLG
jgi:type I restriction enzyme, S subunit